MSAKRIVVDLETYRTRSPFMVEAVRKEQIERRPAQNTPVPVKAGWDTEKGREDRVREALAKTSVDVLYAEILCIALGADDNPPEVITCMPDNERDGIELFCDWANENIGPETVWVNHRLVDFDLKILLNRMRAHHIQPPDNFPVFRGRYWDGRVYDTMLRTPSENKIGYVKLSEACLAYGIESSKGRICLTDGTPLEGSTVGLAFERCEYQAICEYAKLDIIATRDLYLAQTFGCTRDTWEAEDASMAAVYEIRDADLPLDQREHLLLKALADKGLISRDILPRELAA